MDQVVIAVLDLGGDPGLTPNMSIMADAKVINHPIDRLARLAPAELKALRGAVHLFLRKAVLGHQNVAEGTVIRSTLVDHTRACFDDP